MAKVPRKNVVGTQLDPQIFLGKQWFPRRKSPQNISYSWKKVEEKTAFSSLIYICEISRSECEAQHETPATLKVPGTNVDKGSITHFWCGLPMQSQHFIPRRQAEKHTFRNIASDSFRSISPFPVWFRIFRNSMGTVLNSVFIGTSPASTLPSVTRRYSNSQDTVTKWKWQCVSHRVWMESREEGDDTIDLMVDDLHGLLLFITLKLMLCSSLEVSIVLAYAHRKYWYGFNNTDTTVQVLVLVLVKYF